VRISGTSEGATSLCTGMTALQSSGRTSQANARTASFWVNYPWLTGKETAGARAQTRIASSIIARKCRKSCPLLGSHVKAIPVPESAKRSAGRFIHGKIPVYCMRVLCVCGEQLGVETRRLLTRQTHPRQTHPRQTMCSDRPARIGFTGISLHKYFRVEH